MPKTQTPQKSPPSPSSNKRQKTTPNPGLGSRLRSRLHALRLSHHSKKWVINIDSPILPTVNHPYISLTPDPCQIAKGESSLSSGPAHKSEADLHARFTHEDSGSLNDFVMVTEDMVGGPQPNLVGQMRVDGMGFMVPLRSSHVPSEWVPPRTTGDYITANSVQHSRPQSSAYNDDDNNNNNSGWANGLNIIYTQQQRQNQLQQQQSLSSPRTSVSSSNNSIYTSSHVSAASHPQQQQQQHYRPPTTAIGPSASNTAQHSKSFFPLLVYTARSKSEKLATKPFKLRRNRTAMEKRRQRNKTPPPSAATAHPHILPFPLPDKSLPPVPPVPSTSRFESLIADKRELQQPHPHHHQQHQQQQETSPYWGLGLESAHVAQASAPMRPSMSANVTGCSASSSVMATSSTGRRPQPKASVPCFGFKGPAATTITGGPRLLGRGNNNNNRFSIQSSVTDIQPPLSPPPTNQQTNTALVTLTTHDADCSASPSPPSTPPPSSLSSSTQAVIRQQQQQQGSRPRTTPLRSIHVPSSNTVRPCDSSDTLFEPISTAMPSPSTENHDVFPRDTLVADPEDWSFMSPPHPSSPESLLNSSAKRSAGGCSNGGTSTTWRNNLTLVDSPSSPTKGKSTNAADSTTTTTPPSRSGFHRAPLPFSFFEQHTTASPVVAAKFITDSMAPTGKSARSHYLRQRRIQSALAMVKDLKATRGWTLPPPPRFDLELNSTCPVKGNSLDMVVPRPAPNASGRRTSKVLQSGGGSIPAAFPINISDVVGPLPPTIISSCSSSLARQGAADTKSSARLLWIYALKRIPFIPRCLSAAYAFQVAAMTRIRVIGGDRPLFWSLGRDEGISLLLGSDCWVSATGLESLAIVNVGISQLPIGIKGHTSLRDLDLTDNWIGAVPAWISTITNLAILRLRGNPIASMPTTLVTGCRNLRVLDIDHLPRRGLGVEHSIAHASEAELRLSLIERIKRRAFSHVQASLAVVSRPASQHRHSQDELNRSVKLLQIYSEIIQRVAQNESLPSLNRLARPPPHSSSAATDGVGGRKTRPLPPSSTVVATPTDKWERQLLVGNSSSSSGSSSNTSEKPSTRSSPSPRAAVTRSQGTRYPNLSIHSLSPLSSATTAATLLKPQRAFTVAPATGLHSSLLEPATFNYHRRYCQKEEGVEAADNGSGPTPSPHTFQMSSPPPPAATVTKILVQ